jgi:hypothetical protein
MTIAIVARQDTREAATILPPQRELLKMPYGLTIFSGACVAAIGALRWHL